MVSHLKHGLLEHDLLLWYTQSVEHHPCKVALVLHPRLWPLHDALSHRLRVRRGHDAATATAAIRPATPAVAVAVAGGAHEREDVGTVAEHESIAAYDVAAACALGSVGLDDPLTIHVDLAAVASALDHHLGGGGRDGDGGGGGGRGRGRGRGGGRGEVMRRRWQAEAEVGGGGVESALLLELR